MNLTKKDRQILYLFWDLYPRYGVDIELVNRETLMNFWQFTSKPFSMLHLQRHQPASTLLRIKLKLPFSKFLVGPSVLKSSVSDATTSRIHLMKHSLWIYHYLVEQRSPLFKNHSNSSLQLTSYKKITNICAQCANHDKTRQKDSQSIMPQEYWWSQ